MRRRKRFTIKMVALGFAVAALAAPPAQAYLDSAEGGVAQSGSSQVVVSPDDRSIHGTNPQVVTSPDDRPIHGGRLVPSPQTVTADDGSGFELSNAALTGIGLGLLAAAMAAYAARQVRRSGKLARA